MKLRELLQQMQEIKDKIGTAQPYICGGTPRDRYLKHLENISDLDLTTGDKTVDYLSQEFAEELSRKYNVTRRTMSDGHSTIYIGTFKMDFSSNFNVPNIDNFLQQRGITKPTDMQREMYSRDFTCNSLLLSLDLKDLVDPTHKGFKDIGDRMIRTCLSPEITLTTNRNRVIRAIYLASKLDFDIDPTIVEYVKAHPESVKISTEKVMTEKLNEAFNRDADKASHYITKMNIWGEIPITEVVKPYYLKHSQQKVAYFQGGGGVNEPTPGKKKYKSDKAIVVQPRFKEPFYRNYDAYDIPGFEHIGPGAGWHSMQKYKSVSEFLEAKRKKMKDKYKADDSWIEDDGKKTKKVLRAEALYRLVKMGAGDYMLPPKEHGTSIYNWKNSPYQGVPKAPKKHDSNNIDFPNDDYIDPEIASGESENGIMHQLNPGGGYLDKYLPEDDFEGKPPTELDFGRDYTEGMGSSPIDHKVLEKLMRKYLAPTSHGLYGLPDGVDLPDEDLGDPTDLNPDYGTTDSGNTLYEDKWNI